MNQSQAFSPMSAKDIEPVSQLDIEREKRKIARYIHTKERSGQVLAARESRIEARIKDMEKKQKEFEKKKRVERKQVMSKVNEK